jgi:hypothetical protein
MSRKPRSGSRIYEGIALLVDTMDPGRADSVAKLYGSTTAGRRVEAAIEYLGELVDWYEESSGKAIRAGRPEGGAVASLDGAHAPAERPKVSTPAVDPLAPVVGGAFRLGDVPVIVRGINDDGSIRVRWCGGTERTVTASAWRRDVANLPAMAGYADISRSRVI